MLWATAPDAETRLEDRTLRRSLLALGLFLCSLGAVLVLSEQPQVPGTFCAVGALLCTAGLGWSAYYYYSKHVQAAARGRESERRIKARAERAVAVKNGEEKGKTTTLEPGVEKTSRSPVLDHAEDSCPPSPQCQTHPAPTASMHSLNDGALPCSESESSNHTFSSRRNQLEETNYGVSLQCGDKAIPSEKDLQKLDG
uniref:Uncharacterized protein n=1 Tax=Eptatretus burgeri TaxID=7764 RepID=A0A8C4WX50_EPTBU